MSRNWAAGSTVAWRSTRQGVIARDGARCRMADVRDGRYLPRTLGRYRHLITVSPDCTGGTAEYLQVHHLLGRAVTGDDPAYLVACCRACNLATGDPTRADPPCSPQTDWS